MYPKYFCKRTLTVVLYKVLYKMNGDLKDDYFLKSKVSKLYFVSYITSVHLISLLFEIKTNFIH